jgi:hypothetical protein
VKAILSALLVGVLLAALGLAAQPARANYSIAGQWQVDFGSGPCPVTITQSYGTSAYSLITMTFACSPLPATILDGSIGTLSGLFSASDAVFPTNTLIVGSAGPGGATIHGTWQSPYGRGTFTGTGGGGGPKPPTPTPLAVGGVALDVPARSANTFDARWLLAIASASIAALGGAAMYARRRFVS